MTKQSTHLWLAWLGAALIVTSAMSGCTKNAQDARAKQLDDAKKAAAAATQQAAESTSDAPADASTAKPADALTETPSDAPADMPSDAPTATPSDVPAVTPTDAPTEAPSESSAGAATVPSVVAMTVEIPLGLPELKVPDDNPMTAEKVELGKMLYFDKRLSKDGTISCATCHDPQKGWAEHSATSTGIGGQVGGANSPTVINAAFADAQFWDGRAATLEAQALGPIENPIEMGHSLDVLVSQLNAIPGYQEKFQQVFQTDVTKEGIAKAIAAFERTVLSGNSSYDKFKAGDATALTDVQKKGMQLFDDLGCATCHAPPTFSNYKYYNAGIGSGKEKPDEGRKAVTGNEGDLGKYRAPALREVAKTGPYFHDGSCDSLEKAVAVMATGGIDNPNLSTMLKGLVDKQVSAEDQVAIVEFLKGLSGTYPIIEAPALP